MKEREREREEENFIFIMKKRRGYANWKEDDFC